MATKVAGGSEPVEAENAWRVLVVEDEYYIADDLKRELEAHGAEIIGPVSTIDRALALIGEGSGVSIAVLDVKLGDDLVWPVVEALRVRGVEYVFATGYDGAELPPAYRTAPLFRKPLDSARLAEALLLSRDRGRRNVG